MSIGSMNFPLYLARVPDNITLTIKEVKPVLPSDAWYAHASIPALPFTVDPNKNNGRIGEFHLSANGFTSNGHGPSFEIKFTVSGVSQDGTQSSRDGYITISTSDWGLAGRPNQGIVTVVFDGSAAQPYVMDTPFLVALDDVQLVLLYLPQEKTVAMTVTFDKTIISQICDLALQGIFKFHEKTVSWVLGKVW